MINQNTKLTCVSRHPFYEEVVRERCDLRWQLGKGVLRLLHEREGLARGVVERIMTVE